MSDARKVECSTHGTRSAAFICKHLAQGEGSGFNTGYDPEALDALCPDAWCDACEVVLDQQGEWDSVAEAFAGIKVVCSGCYNAAREENWIQDEQAFVDLTTRSCAYLQERQSQLIESYKLGSYERWDWYQETGLLVFSHAGKPRVEAAVSFSGSFSTVSNSWMWAWANESLSENVKSASRAIREIGERQRYLKLAAAHWSADEVDGWEMTSIMAQQLGAIGAYRTPRDSGFMYMIVHSARWLDESET